MALINSTFFAQKKNSASSKTASSGFAGTSYTNVSTTFATEADRLSVPRNIWGQPFDGTEDITGSFLLDNSSASMQVYAPFKAGSYYAKDVSFIYFQPTENATENSKFYFKRTDVDLEDSAMHLWSNDTGNILNLDSTGIMQKLVNNTVNLNANGLNFSNDASIYSGGTLTIAAAESINMDFGNGEIHANSGYFNNLYSNGSGDIYVGDNLLVESMQINGNLSVQNLTSQNIRNSNDITTKNIYVTGTAHFFDLEIDKITNAGGQIILSAGSFHIDDFESATQRSTATNYGLAGPNKTDQRYKTIYLYQLAEDASGQRIDCTVKRYDQLVCWTANVHSTNQVDLRHWWTLVYNVSSSPILRTGPDGNRHRYYRIEIVQQVRYREGGSVYHDPFTGKVNPKIGDDCAVLGSRSNNSARRNAIMIASTASFDTNFTAPAWVQYENVNTFSLNGKAKTWFAANGNHISGELIISNTQESVESVLNAIRNKTYYLHTAYANDDAGTDFIHANEVVDSTAYAYIGLCTDDNSDDSEYTYDRYTWSRVQGNERDKLIPIRERLYLNSSDNLILDVAYYNALWVNSGNTITAVLQTYGGSTSTKNVNNTDTDQVYYTNTVQSAWSEVANNSKYAYATVYLKDANNNILDQHSISVQFEAGAVLSITDSIKSRVSDAEGNISTLTQTATSLTSRIGTADSSISILEQTASSLSLRMQQAENELALIVEPDSVYVELSNLKGDVNQLQLDVSGLKQSTTALDASLDSVIRTQSEFEVGVGGLTSRLDTVEQTQSNVSESLSTVREQQSIIQQKIDNINLSVSDKTVGGQNILYSADFGKINDDFVKTDWYSQNNFLQYHSSGTVKSSLIEPSKYGPLPDGTIGYFECMTDPANVQNGSDLFHYDAPSGNYLFEMLRQEITGRLKPSTWYTLSFWVKLPYTSTDSGFKFLKTYVYPSVGNPNYKYYINGKESINTPSDVNVDWRNDNDVPSSNGWKRYSVTFKTRDDFSQTASCYVLFRAVVDNNGGSHRFPNYAIAQPKLEEGQYATQFNYSQHDLEAQISVKANEIALRVRNGLTQTGINIEQNLITLDAARTIINGNLNIRDDSGLTVYDSDNIARIQIQPQSVGSVFDWAMGSFTYLNLNAYVTASLPTNFIINTDESSINIDEGAQISIVDPIAYLSYDQQFCTSPTANLTITIKKNSSTVFERSVTAYLDSTAGTPLYIYSGTMKYTADASGEYTVQARITCADNVPADATMYGNVNIRIEYPVEHCTVAGLDGFKSYAGVNKALFVGPDGIKMQMQNNGIRFIENKPMQVACGYAGSGATATETIWLPFYNYCPIFRPQWTYSYIPHMQFTRYIYRINPEQDFGDCLIEYAPRNNNYDRQEGWICLPETSWQKNGNIYSLPEGYRVKIINSTIQDEAVTIYVTTYSDLSTSQYYASGKQAVIIDSNRNLNAWSRLRDEQCTDTFIWTGYFWIQEHDTQ